MNFCGPGSVVGIVTAYGLDGPGIEFESTTCFRTDRLCVVCTAFSTKAQVVSEFGGVSLRLRFVLFGDCGEGCLFPSYK
jgi:hypothetical protein